ncbi:MAG: sensor domain-containing diguanylate cyclase [Planctomycetota bacterium]
MRKKTTTDLRERLARLQAADEERRKAVEALRASEDFSASLLANSPNPIAVINLDTSIRYVNPALVELTGFAADDVVGTKAPYPWWPEDKRDEIGRNLERAMETGVRNVEVPFAKKDGEPFWVEVSFSPIMSGGEPRCYVSSWVDITGHKRFEERLAGERALLRTLIDNLPDLIYVKDAESRFITGNIAVARLMGGAEPEDLVGKTDADFYPGELASKFRADEESVMRSGEPLISRIETAIGADGRTRWFSTTKVPLCDGDGNVTGIVGVGRDITEHKRAEDALAAERAVLRTLIDNLPDRIYVKDTESRFITANKACARLMGVESHLELVGKTDLEFHPEELAKKYRADEEEVIRTGRAMIGEEEEVRGPGGETRWLSTTKVPLRDASGEVIGLVGMGRDITERRELEEALKEMNAELELQARTDALTGALSRRFLEHDLPILYDAYARSGGPIAVAMFDLDYLKQINDAHGHDVGDEALRTFVATAQQQLRRKTDMLIRYGGDEFMLVFFAIGRAGREAPPADVTAEEYCTALLETMRGADIPGSKPGGGPVRLTFSAGVAGREGREPLDAIIKRADEALYVAKSGGRDRVVRYAPGMKGEPPS